MKAVRGAVVRSAAGRDKGDFQIIMDCDETYAYVCDGKHRPLESMKKKKLRHLKITNTLADEESISSNRLIRKVLRPFKDKASEVGFR